jgi:hypothetical protein
MRDPLLDLRRTPHREAAPQGITNHHAIGQQRDERRGFIGVADGQRHDANRVSRGKETLADTAAVGVMLRRAIVVAGSVLLGPSNCPGSSKRLRDPRPSANARVDSTPQRVAAYQPGTPNQDWVHNNPQTRRRRRAPTPCSWQSATRQCTDNRRNVEKGSRGGPTLKFDKGDVSHTLHDGNKDLN